MPARFSPSVSAQISASRSMSRREYRRVPPALRAGIWLGRGSTQAESTVTGHRIMVRHLIELIGKVKLAELKVRDVELALGKLAKRLSTRSVRLARMILIQAIRNAMVNDLVVRNVADLTVVPTGKAGTAVQVTQPGAGSGRAGRS
jgi:hypothetical protein